MYLRPQFLHRHGALRHSIVCCAFPSSFARFFLFSLFHRFNQKYIHNNKVSTPSTSSQLPYGISRALWRNEESKKPPDDSAKWTVSLIQATDNFSFFPSFSSLVLLSIKNSHLLPFHSRPRTAQMCCWRQPRSWKWNELSFPSLLVKKLSFTSRKKSI